MKMKHFLFATALVTPILLTSCVNPSGEDDTKADNGTVITGDNGDEVYDKITGDAMTPQALDSIFLELISTAESFETVNSADEAFNLEFARLAEQFGAVTKVDSANMKANVGYAVARILSLNSNEALQKVADSLDVYFSEMDDFNSTSSVTNVSISDTIHGSRSAQEASNDLSYGSLSSKVFGGREDSDFFGRSLRSGGIDGLGVALLAKSPEIVLSRAEIPSLPKFLTINHIQNLLESEVIPALNGAINAFERIEKFSDANATMTFVVDGETVEIGLAEIYLLDASMRTLRSGLLSFTTYNYDIWTSANDKSYSWVEEMIRLGDASEKSQYTYTLSSDTLYKTETISGNTDLCNYAYDVMKYNMERSDFLTISRANHDRAYQDLKAVPELMRKAILALENETGDQTNDLIKKVKFDNLSGDLVDIQDELLRQEYSYEFASNFKSPKSVANFIEEVLTSPYTFSEVINGTSFDVTIDISKLYTNPEENLRNWLPKYKFRNKSEIMQPSPYTNVSWSYYSSSFRIDSEYETVVIADELLDTVLTYGNEMQYVLNGNYNYRIREGLDFDPLTLADDEGEPISWETMEIMLENGEVPFFSDYTFNGVFPDMTRAKWNSLVNDLIEVL